MNLSEGLYDDQPTTTVRETLAAAHWALTDIEQNPEAYPANVRAVFEEVVAEAERELASRPTGPTPATSTLPDLDLIRERIDLPGYIKHRASWVEYRPLPSGELLTRCPWPDHADRTPSFSVNPAKGVWLCRGCGRGGSIFDFVMRWDGFTFREAIEHLAWEARLAPRPPRVATSRPRDGARRGVVTVD